MNDMIIKAAQDPSCILAVTPDRGGSWWSALRPGGNYPWPSPVPRNFAEEPETWYAAAAASSEISMHDFYFEIEFISYQKPESSEPVFYNIRVYEPFGVCLRNDGNIIATVTYTNLWEGAGRQYLSLLEDDFGYGEPVRIKVIRQNGVIKIFCNDTEKKTITMPSAPAPVQFTTMPSANFNGTIKRITIFDLTTGKTVWSYPSEAERVRLLTKTNVRTDRGVFEAADTSRRWDVTTQLRAASLLPECTIIVAADNPNGERTTFVSCAQRTNPTHGFFVIRKQDTGSVMFGYSGKNSSGVTSYPTRYITCPNGKHVFAFVLDYSALQLRIYIDGEEVDNRAMDTGLVAPPEFDGTEKPVILGVTSTSDGLNLTSKISHCLIFDRALTAAEIAALCPTAN